MSRANKLHYYMKNTFIIMGGGIAGLSTAIALRRIGIEATVYEAAPEFKPVGAGITLAANAMKAYRILGLFDDLVAAGRPLTRMSIRAQKGGLLSESRVDTLPGGLCNLAIHRAALHEVLLSQLDPGQVIAGKRSADILQEEGRYTVTFEDGTQTTSKHLIVAEGIHSLIRRKLLPQARIRYAGYTCWRGIAPNGDMGITDTSETWGANGRFGIVPIGNDQIYWFATKNAPAGSPVMKAYSNAELLDNYRSYHDPIGEVIRRTPPEYIFWNDIIDLEPMPRFAFDNLVFVGDAAHATTPNMGQGACQAIEDAIVLAQCLQQNAAVKEAFALFEQRRLKRVHWVVNQSHILGKIAQWENPLLRGLRNTAFRLTPDSVMTKQQEKIYEVDF